jgi:site-specific DNA-methyltransferase (adenine-specific)
MWVYGSGFPKSHNIGKAVDKLQGNDREVVGMKRSGMAEGPFGNPEESKKHIEDTKGTSEWEGWGTALKPAHEPIVMARKPLSEKTVAENVLRWGTGGINIDESRIEYKGDNDKWKIDHSKETQQTNPQPMGKDSDDLKRTHVDEPHEGGRWPANIIFDEEAGQVLDQQSGISNSKKQIFNAKKQQTIYGNGNGLPPLVSERGHNDKGGASRFFYCPKASKKDRDEGMDGFEETISEISQINSQTKLQPNGEYVENKVLPRKNNHPTVKPTELMLYLIKLVTPVKGVVLDPFMGSGSTGKGATRGGFDFIGIEREEEYIKIAEARIKNEMK